MKLVFFIVILFSNNLTAEESEALFVGDSLSSGSRFGFLMVEFLRNPGQFCSTDNGARNLVKAYARPSAATRHWRARSGSSKKWLCKQKKIYVNGTASRDTSGRELCRASGEQSVFEKLLGIQKPNVVMIALGANSLGFSDRFVTKEIRGMLAQIPRNTLCFWITPPLASAKYLPQIKRMELLTRDAVGDRCLHVPTVAELTGQTVCERFNARDGIHHTACGSRLWGQTVIDKICDLSF